MGVGHLDIGENVGSAKVFNPMPAIQQYGQILAQKQAKHEAEVKALGDELAKGYDPNGLRNDADKTEYIKRFRSIQADAIAAENEKNKDKKILALSNIRQRLTDLSAFSTGSKNLDKFEREAAKEHALHPYVYDDNTSKKLLDQRNRTWDHPDNVKDWSGIERGVDPAKQEEKYNKLNEEILKHHPATYGTEKIAYGQNVFGRKTATGTQERVIPYQDALEMHLHAATADLDYQKHLQNKYPQIQDPNPQKQLALRVAQDMHDHGDANGVFDKPKVKDYEDVAPVRPSYLESFYMKNFGVPYNPNMQNQREVNNSPIYRQAWISDILHGNQEARMRAASTLAIDPSFNGKMETGVGEGKHKGQLIFKIPAKISKYDEKGNPVEKIPARTVWIDTKDKNANVKLNELLNEVSGGEKVDISALETPGGKKHIGVQGTAQPKSYTIPGGRFKGTHSYSDVHGKAVKAGVSDQEYIDWLSKQ